jgi:hypothetical protein
MPMIKRLTRKAKSKSKSMTSVWTPRLRLFGPPQILEGEDAAAYDELAARICAAVKPSDFIEEMFAADSVHLHWEVLRWRRLKWTLMQTTGLNELKDFLVRVFESNYALHAEHFESYLVTTLQNGLPTDQADAAEKLAAECAPNTSEATDKLDKLLDSIGLNTNSVLHRARAQRADELVRAYVRRDPDAVTLIDELLTAEGASMDAFMTDALIEKLNYTSVSIT